MLVATTVVVGALALLAGELLGFLDLFAVEWIVGDRPAPIAPWQSWTDGVPFALSFGAGVMVVALVGLGLGVVIRSSVGTLVALAGLLFVLPTAALLLPASWGQQLWGFMLMNLPAELAGHGSVSAPVAAAVLAGYLVLPLGAAAIVLHRRDA